MKTNTLQSHDGNTPEPQNDGTRLADALSMTGRVVLVTGSAGGMGAATAKVFADAGAHVAATDVSDGGLERVVADIVGSGGSARGYRLDVSDAQSIQSIVAAVADDLGGIDCLVNNAGIGAGAAIDSDDFEAIWERAFSVLVTAQVRMIRACLPHLRQSTAARIVNIASTEGLGATPRISPYTAAKTSVTGLTRSLAVELGPEGITVNCICPGPINTNMTSGIPEESKAVFARRRTALRRYGEPEEVAHMTFCLCLPGSSYITGAVIPVDGGLMARNA